MKFGKLSDISEVDFTLQPLDILNEAQLSNSKINFYLGTTGWSNKEWNGSYYPKGTNSKSYLSNYAKLFNTIELNTTHYHIPSEEKINSWHSKVEDSFNFCPKVPQVISHRSNLASETSQTNTFFKAIQSFKENLGPCFMQLPEYFSPQNADQLLYFLKRKPFDIKFAIELRHKDWFTENARHLRSLGKELSGFNTTLIITDVAGRRDVCHGILPNQTLMIRLVGNAGHLTDKQRMDSWIDLIAAKKSELKDVYLFFHQPKMELVPDMVNYFILKMSEKGLKSPISELKPKYQPNIQLSLF